MFTFLTNIFSGLCSIIMARSAGLEPATNGLASYYMFPCPMPYDIVVGWTISSPFQVEGV